MQHTKYDVRLCGSLHDGLGLVIGSKDKLYVGVLLPNGLCALLVADKEAVLKVRMRLVKGVEGISANVA